MRTMGSSVSDAPLGNSSVVGCVISGSRLPMRTFNPGVTQDQRQLCHVLQIELVARVVLRDEQHAARLRADLLDGALRGLHAQRQEIRIEVVEAAGEQIGIHRRQLETAVAQVDRGVERDGVFQPLRAEPALDVVLFAEEALLQTRAAGLSVRW